MLFNTRKQVSCGHFLLNKTIAGTQIPIPYCGLTFTTFLLTVDLLGLLNWRSNSQNIGHNLKKLMDVAGGEIVKVQSGHTGANLWDG